MSFNTKRNYKRDSGHIQNGLKDKSQFNIYEPVEKLPWNKLCVYLIGSYKYTGRRGIMNILLKPSINPPPQNKRFK